MHRRNFLRSSGIIIPAIIAVPAAVFAGPQKTTVKVLLVQGITRKDPGLTGYVKDAFKESFSQLDCKAVKRLCFSGSEFSVLTNDNRIIIAEKIILNTFYKIDSPANSIEIKTAESGFHLDYDKTTGGPEFWSFTSGTCSRQKLLPFAKRKGNAFLCIS